MFDGPNSSGSRTAAIGLGSGHSAPATSESLARIREHQSAIYGAPYAPPVRPEKVDDTDWPREIAWQAKNLRHLIARRRQVGKPTTFLNEALELVERALRQATQEAA